MSIKATSWALRKAPVGSDCTARLILTLLADYARALELSISGSFSKLAMSGETLRCSSMSFTDSASRKSSECFHRLPDFFLAFTYRVGKPALEEVI